MRERDVAFSPGDGPISNEETSRFAVSLWVWLVLNTCLNLNPRWYPVLACPKTISLHCLCFATISGKKETKKKTGGGENITLWDIALFQSLVRSLPTFHCCWTCWKSVSLGVFCQASCNGGGVGCGGWGESLTGVSLSWAARAQQIDSPCLLPFSTDRFGAWALSQHYQSILSYPQPLTLIGRQPPKGQGSMNHSPAMRNCYASKCTCLCLKNHSGLLRR